MFIRKLLSKTKKHKNIFNYSIYALFFSYMTYLIVKESNILGTIPYFLVLLIFGSLAFLNEYLKTLYAKSILLLTDHCDPNEGLKLIERIEHLDIFKAYKKPIIIFRLLALRDLGNIDELLSYAKSLDIEKLTFSKDIILTYNYTLFMAYINVKHDDKVSIYYKNLISMKKTNKYPPIFSWNEIAGTYHFYNSNLSESKKYFNKVKTNKMNQREKLHFFFKLSKLYLALKNYDDSLKYLKEITLSNSNISISYEAQNILNSLYKNKSFQL